MDYVNRVCQGAILKINPLTLHFALFFVSRIAFGSIIRKSHGLKRFKHAVPASMQRRGEMYRVVSILGSPRRKGNSATLAENVGLGAQSAGAEVETYFIHGMNIRPCDACGACHEKANTACIIDDDMRKIYPKLHRADALVIASPIYWFTVSAQTKLFIDRCYSLWNSGEYALKGKRVGIVLTYEDADPFVSGAVNAIRTFQDIFAYVNASVVGMVYGRAAEPGEIATDTQLMDKAFELGKRLVL